MCRDLERGVVQTYSKELRELVSNTVQHMIDQMQETIDQKDAQLGEKTTSLTRRINSSAKRMTTRPTEKFDRRIAESDPGDAETSFRGEIQTGWFHSHYAGKLFQSKLYNGKGLWIA